MENAARSNVSQAIIFFRALFVVYVVALVTGTHWPRLRVDLGDQWPLAMDKVIHFAAYAGLVLFAWLAQLWRTGPTRRLVKVSLAIVVMAVLDEVTQQLVPGRSFSLLDMAASAGGGVAAILLITATTAKWRKQTEGTGDKR